MNANLRNFALWVIIVLLLLALFYFSGVDEIAKSVVAIGWGLGVVILLRFAKVAGAARAWSYLFPMAVRIYPSIVFGLFVYIALIVGTGSTYAGYKGSIALALLMLPIVIRSGEVVLLLVPNSLRESALALGAPRWKVIGRVVLPTALPGMLTGMLLAVARAAGETAPLLFTAAAAHETTLNLGGFMNSLPVQIYSDVTSPTAAVVERAWGAALTLVLLILVLNMVARLLSRRNRLA